MSRILNLCDNFSGVFRLGESSGEQWVIKGLRDGPFWQSEIKSGTLADLAFSPDPSPIKEASEGEIVVLVDTGNAKEGISRAVPNQGWRVKSIESNGSSYSIAISNE